MIPVAACAVAFLGTLLAARRSLGDGMIAVVTVGYFYGIVRANYLSTATHLLFDFAVAGLYVGLAPQVLAAISDRESSKRAAVWTMVLVGWPVVLFFVPGYDPALQFVGLRANALFVPFILIGSMAAPSDLRRLAVWLACLNITVLGLAVAEFLTDVRHFFPKNEVTKIIYASNDLVGFTAFRIPSSFVNAHAYAGTMVVSAAFLLAAFATHSRRWWDDALVYMGLAAAVIGVFLGASRTHAGVMFLVGAVVTVSGGLGRRAIALWFIVIVGVGWVVSREERLQRFTSLRETAVVSTRLGWSVNDGLIDIMTGYPLGHGLAGGGSSVPYFLESRMESPLRVENEYGRMAAEQGTPGLLMWVALILWFILQLPQGRSDPWFVARLAGWTTVVVYFGSAMIGNGLLTSIPQSALFLTLVGWVSSTPAGADCARLVAPETAPWRPGWRGGGGAVV